MFETDLKTLLAKVAKANETIVAAKLPAGSQAIAARSMQQLILDGAMAIYADSYAAAFLLKDSKKAIQKLVEIHSANGKVVNASGSDVIAEVLSAGNRACAEAMLQILAPGDYPKDKGGSK